jgi:hypothetical protein
MAVSSITADFHAHPILAQLGSLQLSTAAPGTMKSTTIAALAALWVQNASAHATFQQLWVDGVDYGSQCARLPVSNSPVTNVASNDVRCNVIGTRPGGKCPVKAGSTVTVEMHQVRTDNLLSPAFVAELTGQTFSNPVTGPAPAKPSAAPTTGP